MPPDKHQPEGCWRQAIGGDVILTRYQQAKIWLAAACGRQLIQQYFKAGAGQKA
ncbi:hypothetical protein [Erwinia mallotivora]|uniref:hypothetical protein n=1 Tax=Erwinia mallotivora TaxID=69222 RepID=UPI0021C1AA5B|nr:hypothetical protein [Erwinia mallotivora]